MHFSIVKEINAKAQKISNGNFKQHTVLKLKLLTVLTCTEICLQYSGQFLIVNNHCGLRFECWLNLWNCLYYYTNRGRSA